jgi:hypothetical protein
MQFLQLMQLFNHKSITSPSFFISLIKTAHAPHGLFLPDLYLQFISHGKS